MRNVAWITSDEFDNVEDDISFQHVSWKKCEKRKINAMAFLMGPLAYGAMHQKTAVASSAPIFIAVES